MKGAGAPMSAGAVLRDARTGAWQVFGQPVDVIEARKLAEVLPCLEQVERAVEGRGLHAVGFLSYEAAPAFDRVLAAHRPAGVPLVWFGLFAEPFRANDLPGPSLGGGRSAEWTSSVSAEQHAKAVSAIQKAIAAGDTYQVNYTHRMRAPLPGDAWRVFRRLVAAQPGRYAAYVDAGSIVVCSVSPEMFLERDGRRLVSAPMKGTVARGRFPAEDRRRAEWLRCSEKDLAEHVMIVDMVRNDLGRIADVGSVVVESLYDVERLPAVWQMTSKVSALSDADLVSTLAALFPAASITGAPKASTMRWIRDLEDSPRGVYTGSVAWLAPGRRWQMSVAIRTAVVDVAAGQLEYGVGGGIVWDSVAGEEWQECRNKARVLAGAPERFDLFETMRWTREGGFVHHDDHMDRLAASADYFDFVFRTTDVRAALARAAANQAPDAPAVARVRLVLSPDGAFSIAFGPAPPPLGRPVRLRLAMAAVPTDDVTLFHKTTQRYVYDAAVALRGDADDVVLWNEKGEVTETTIGNLVFRIDGMLVTPPVECGLLGGTARSRLVAAGAVKEHIVPVTALARCSEVFRVNALRGMEPAVLLP